jgi:hypothetical protein
VPEVTLFAGPSTYGLDRAALLKGGVQLRPPVRRGDIDRLVDGPSTAGVMVVCDGVFQSVPAVSHAELCSAMDAGWEVWGVSSIGAIRAFELRDEGMRGFGYVYEQFMRHADFTDDEMCLLHFPEDPWFPLTEALVNLRYAVDGRRDDLGLSAEATADALAALSRAWFGDRTPGFMRTTLTRAGVPGRHADALLEWTAANRIKSLDLWRLMQVQPWLR